MTPPRRIVVFGTESTGKTTLATRLAARFAAPWSPEYVRQYWDDHHGHITAADLDAIARGQIANEDAATAQAAEVVFCDTDLLTCTIWDDLLFPGDCPPWVRSEAERRAAGTALFLLCDADVPFVPDAPRSFPDPADRERARQVWRTTLLTRKLPFVDVRGDWPDRERIAVSAVERLLQVGRA